MTLIFAISIVAFTIGNLLAGKIESPVIPPGLPAGQLCWRASSGPRWWTAPPRSWWSTSPTAFLPALSVGSIYNVVLRCASWFPDACGMAQGVSLMGFGMGGFLLGPVAAQLYTVLDWRVAFVGVGVVFSALTVACSLILREARPTSWPSSPPFPAQPAGGTDAAPVRDCGMAQIIPGRPLALYVFLFMLGSVGMGITGIGKELPASLGADALGAAFVIGFVNVGNGLGRLVAGTLLDRLGRGRTMVGVGLLSMVGTILLVLSLLGESTALMTVACLVAGLAWGAAVVCMPFVTRTEWGMANMASNMAVVNTYSIFGAVLGSWGAGLLAERLGSFIPVLVIMAFMGAAETLVVWPWRASPPLVPPDSPGSNKGIPNCSCRLSRTAWLLPDVLSASFERYIWERRNQPSHVILQLFSWIRCLLTGAPPPTTTRLAARMRPQTLDEYLGQAQAVGEGSWLRRAIEHDTLSSVLLYGPAGTGKTTLARIIAHSTHAEFVEVSAVTGTVKDLRREIEAAESRLLTSGRRTILFVDEIHRFNRSQQDALLHAVEDRTVVLVGATTENPYFEVNSALISRSRVVELQPLDDASVRQMEARLRVRGTAWPGPSRSRPRPRMRS